MNDDITVTKCANMLADVIQAMKEQELLTLDEAIICIHIVDYANSNQDAFISYLINSIKSHK